MVSLVMALLKVIIILQKKSKRKESLAILFEVSLLAKLTLYEFTNGQQDHSFLGHTCLFAR